MAFQLYLMGAKVYPARKIFSRSVSVSSSFLAQGMAKLAPAFPADDVEVLATPPEFFATLKQGAADAHNRIVMASLYIGTGPLEQELLNVIADAARSRPSLQVMLLFDALRSTRPIGESDYESSAQMLSRVLFPESAELKKRRQRVGESERVNVALFRTPKLRRVLEGVLPPRVSEAVGGVSHMKAYVFDDDILLSGANLSADYFTNRQDRYMLLRRCKGLADYLTSLVETVARFSYKLGGMPHQGSSSKHSTFANFHGNYTPPIIDPRIHPARFQAEMASAVESITKKPLVEVKPQLGTWVFPTVQMGPIGIYQDEICMLWLLEHLPPASHIHFASAYFNLTPAFEEALLHASSDKFLSILTASPQANGFYGSSGISSCIPKFYSSIEQSFFERARKMSNAEESFFKRARKMSNSEEAFIERARKMLNSEEGFFERTRTVLNSEEDFFERARTVSNSVTDGAFQASNNGYGKLHIYEYMKKNWTFHAKGLWCALPSDEKLPSVSIIGSSNFGYRSRQRDFENQLYVMTSEPSLMRKLQNECSALFSSAQRVHSEVFLESHRRNDPMTSLAARMVKAWL